MSSPNSFSGFGVPGSGSDVNRLHDQDDLDIGQLSHHHSLGINSGQSSPGDHTHDGRTSKKLTIPAASVILPQDETIYGVLRATGAAAAYARSDHSHGSPVKPVSTLDAANTTLLTLTAVNQDVAGMSVTVTTTKATAQIIVTAFLDFIVNSGAANQVMIGNLIINGVTQSGEIHGDASVAAKPGTYGQTWARIIGVAAGQIVKIQARFGTGTTGQVQLSHSRMTVLVCDV